MDIKPTSTYPATYSSAGSLAGAPARAAGAGAPASAPQAAKADAVKPDAGPAPEKEELAQAINSINLALKDRTPGLEFSVDPDTQRAVVKVVDKDTMEVIRQMPSREAMEISKMIDTMQGLLEKQTA